MKAAQAGMKRATTTSGRRAGVAVAGKKSGKKPSSLYGKKV
jgi:hypothetical protein